MANAEVYCKWATQGDGTRAQGGWGRHGHSAASGADGIVALNQHAERLAWEAAWPSIRGYVTRTIGNFPGARLMVKFWVDQQICPSCQKWLCVDVISHLKQLKQAHAGLIVELYAEVLFAGNTNRVRVQRETEWPVTVGLKPRFDEFPAIYN